MLIFVCTVSCFLLQQIDSIEHQKDVVAVKTRDMKTVVTLADDSNLRIWDRTRSKHTQTEEVEGNLMQIKNMR